MLHPNRGFTIFTLFCFLIGLFVGDSWAHYPPSTLNADNFQFNLSWFSPKEDHVLASRTVNLATRVSLDNFANYLGKGRDLLCSTQMDDAAASERMNRNVVAQYTTVAQMEAVGWSSNTATQADITDVNTNLEKHLGGNLLDELGVDLSNNVVTTRKLIVASTGYITVAAYDELTDKEQENTATASYQCLYNVAAGLIAVNSAWSPSHIWKTSSGAAWWPKALTKDAVQELNVGRLSDVMYIEWADQAGTSVTDLKYVIQLDVVNQDSRDMMAAAMRSRNDDWSGEQVFYPGSDEFNFLLGCPNGAAQGWTLVNHKAGLGVKTVSSIILWTSSTFVKDRNELPSDEEDEANARNMCFIMDEVEDTEWWGLCQHMLFTFDDVSASEEAAVDSS